MMRAMIIVAGLLAVGVGTFGLSSQVQSSVETAPGGPAFPPPELPFGWLADQYFMSIQGGVNESRLLLRDPVNRSQSAEAESYLDAATTLISRGEWDIARQQWLTGSEIAWRSHHGRNLENATAEYLRETMVALSESANMLVETSILRALKAYEGGRYGEVYAALLEGRVMAATGIAQPIDMPLSDACLQRLRNFVDDWLMLRKPADDNPLAYWWGAAKDDVERVEPYLANYSRGAFQTLVASIRVTAMLDAVERGEGGPEMFEALPQWRMELASLQTVQDIRRFVDFVQYWDDVYRSQAGIIDPYPPVESLFIIAPGVMADSRALESFEHGSDCSRTEHALRQLGG